MEVKIWILNHYAQPPDMPGGTRHYELGQQLLQHGYAVTVFASSFRHAQRRESQSYSSQSSFVEEVDGLQFVWLRTFAYQRNDWRRLVNMISYLVRSYWWGRRLARAGGPVPKPDIVLGSSVHLLAVLSAYLLARHFKSHFVMEVRDLWPQTLVEMGALSERSPVTRLLRDLEKYLYRHAERIIVLLPKAVDYITRQGIDADKVVWIPNGVNLSDYSPKEPTRTDEPRFTVMYMGAHGQANALDGLLDAAQIVQSRGYTHIHFALVGDGPEKQALLDYQRELGLANVSFRDPLPKSQVPHALQRADALVLLLRDLALYQYGVSLNKLFDYLGAGKPIILAGNPANNLVAEARCGLSVPPGDVPALAEAIISLYEMPPEQRDAMGQRGHSFAEQHYDYALLAKRLMLVLDELQ